MSSPTTRAALEWTTEGASDGNTVKVSRCRACFDPRRLTEQLVS